MSEITDTFSTAQRLHPMTLIQRFLISLPAFVLLLFPLLRSPDRVEIFSTGTIIISALFAFPFIFLRYFRFRYTITPKEIVILSGVLNRQQRSIPIERIQNIEIEQSLLPRITQTAKVKIETAGSARTEGVLELVSLDKAHQIREVVRRYQLQQKEEEPAQSISPELTLEQPATPPPLFKMGMNRVLLVGMLRFSLLYIALMFSAFQTYNPDPDEIELWFTRGWLRPLAEFALNSPLLVTTIVVFLATILSWITGILVSLNRYFGFTLTLSENKLHKKHGLLTHTEGTIPLKKIQTIIFRANMLMRYFGWTALEVQTMGLETSQRGHQVAAPLAHQEEAQSLAQHLHTFKLPDKFESVSPLTIRRALVRLFVFALLIMIPLYMYWTTRVIWLLPALVPLLLWYAVFRYRKHGYALDAQNLYIRRGVFQHYIWVIPVEKFQVLYTRSSVFQRRLGLATLYVDTAGSGAFAYPEIIDIPRETASQLQNTLYHLFQDFFDEDTPPPLPLSVSQPLVP